MAGRSRTRRRTLDYRPRFHRLRDLRTGQGRGATPTPASGAITHCWLSPPAPETCEGPRQQRETVGRVRYARGQLTVRADSGFYAHSVVSVCRKMDVRFSITIRQHKRHNVIEAIPEDAWTPIPYWMDGAAQLSPSRVSTIVRPACRQARTGPRVHARPWRLRRLAGEYRLAHNLARWTACIGLGEI